MDMDINEYFDNCLNAIYNVKGAKKYITYDRLKPLLIEKIKECAFLDGFKFIKIDLDHFLKCFFLHFNSGAQLVEIAKLISLRTFYKYYNLLHKYHIFENLHTQFIQLVGVSCVGVTDSMCVKSNFGNRETSYFYKQKGKKGVKISLLSGINKVIYAFDVKKASLDDRPAFTEMLNNCKNDLKDMTVYADSGYDGKGFIKRSNSSGINIIGVPRKNNKGIYKRKLNLFDKLFMKRKRPYIEHINSIIASYRSLSTKMTRSISRYKTLLSLGVLITSLINYKRNFIHKTKITLRYKN